MDPLADGAADYRDWPIVLAPLDYETAASRGTVTGLVLSRFKRSMSARSRCSTMQI
ncbi:hypothetical protein GS421_03250 [Rhodococcus hoagii]|nr:hypothetical protein [Prescottella equi]